MTDQSRYARDHENAARIIEALATLDEATSSKSSRLRNLAVRLRQYGCYRAPKKP